jgi:hypothetical protein
MKLSSWMRRTVKIMRGWIGVLLVTFEQLVGMELVWAGRREANIVQAEGRVGIVRGRVGRLDRVFGK